MIGVVVSVFASGPVLTAMNTGFESFQKMPQARVMQLAALPDGVTDQGPFKRDTLTLTPAGSKTKGTGAQVSGARQYMVLNSIGSATLDDGKYLFNPATGQIEIQWV